MTYGEAATGSGTTRCGGDAAAGPLRRYARQSSKVFAAAPARRRYPCVMNAFPWLAFFIELPTFVVIAWLYLRGRPAGKAVPVVLLALVATLVTTAWGFRVADPGFGMMWPQVLAALGGYGAFLVVLTAGLAVRRR